MKRRKSYSIIYNVQRIILLVFYTTTMIALFIPLAKWINRLSPENLFPLVLLFVTYLVISVVLGTFIYLVSYIPFNLASAFDPIKNAIASGEIADENQFGLRITLFITRFFDFSFLDIEHAVFQAGDSEMVSHTEIPELLNALKEFDIPGKSRSREEMAKIGKISIDNKSYHLYLLPIWFGEKWLGTISLLSSKRISRLFQVFIMEFENNFIDDQLMHILYYSKVAGK